MESGGRIECFACCSASQASFDEIGLYPYNIHHSNSEPNTNVRRYPKPILFFGSWRICANKKRAFQRDRWIYPLAPYDGQPQQRNVVDANDYVRLDSLLIILIDAPVPIGCGSFATDKMHKNGGQIAFPALY